MVKRFAVLASIFAAILIGLILVLTSQPAPPHTPQQAFNQPPHALTSAEQTTFSQLVCGHASGASNNFAEHCATLIGYPQNDEALGSDGNGFDITLQNIAYGHLTSAQADEAYISYTGDFEPHALNYGGGILFSHTKTGWALKGWYPGGQANRCVLLTPTGQAHFICLNGWAGTGNYTSYLVQTTLPPEQNNHPLLPMNDQRDSLNPNANCQGLQSGQNVPLTISALTPAPGGAHVQVSYVKADTAWKACAASQFASAPTSTITLTLLWHNGSVKITPALNFISASL